MPIDDLQREIFAALRAHRHPDSHVAGAAALLRDEHSPRYSADIDIFHDAQAIVETNAEADAAVLRTQGWLVEWLVRRPGFFRAGVRRRDRGLKIEWVHDSAFRFFPVEPDPLLGFRLHSADLAVNKILAGAGRLVIRDFIDLVYLHTTYLAIGALAWAATGKDPGMSPLLVLNELARHAIYRAEELAELHLAQPLSVQELKRTWLDTLGVARFLVESLPTDEVGCLYLDPQGRPVTPNPGDPGFSRLIRHYGTLRGSWPHPVMEEPA